MRAPRKARDQIRLDTIWTQFLGTSVKYNKKFSISAVCGRFRELFWWRLRDSNARPHACEARANTTILRYKAIIWVISPVFATFTPYLIALFRRISLRFGHRFGHNSALPFYGEGFLCLAGAAGFEPAHTGAKIPCLTVWRCPFLTRRISLLNEAHQIIVTGRAEVI